MEENKNFGRYSQKTKRQANSENISDEYPIVKRFFAAIFDVIANKVEPDFNNFCTSNNLSYRNVEKLITNPHFCMKSEWVAILVVKYGYSADWLLTGRGKMKN